MNYKVSVIVPVFNVARFLPKCVQTLMQQTLSDVEYVFVDDCSTDDSYTVLCQEIEKYSFREKDIRIVRHPKNLGLPSARNSGMKAAQGKFIFHCDSDDYLETNALELLFSKAEAEDADLVWCDWFLSYSTSERYMSQKMVEPINSLNYLREILFGRLKYNVWNKLVKREMYFENNIFFPDGYGMGEDMTMIKIISQVQTVAYVPKALYHYVRYNTGAYTGSFNEMYLQQIQYNAQSAIEYILRTPLTELDKEINCFKLNLKLPFLISNSFSSYRIWTKLYPESNKYLRDNPYLPLQTRWLQQLASLHFYGLIWFYNIIIYKFIYNLKYK